MTDLATFDWLIDYTSDDDFLPESTRLHAPTAAQKTHFGYDWDGEDSTGDVHCGLRGKWSIPGVGSRLSVPRCPDCCDSLGYPHGDGSPKNDHTIRAQEGWT